MTSPTAASDRTIVVGIDGSAHDDDALALAKLLAHLLGARLVAAAVYRKALSADPAAQKFEADLRDVAASWLENLLADPEIPLQLRTVEASSPARGLHELAETIGAEAIVVGSTHRGGLGRVMPGAVGDRLLQESPCAVAIAPFGFAERGVMQPRVLAVGYDMTSESEAAVATAARLAQAAEATLRILSVREELAGGDLRSAALALRDSLPAVLRADARTIDGPPARALLEEAEQGVDLLVLGSRGYGPVGRALAGSVAHHVLEEAPCPVVLVPRAAVANTGTDSSQTLETMGAS